MFGHRSHFGSRYKLGCCGNASFFLSIWHLRHHCAFVCSVWCGLVRIWVCFSLDFGLVDLRLGFVYGCLRFGCVSLQVRCDEIEVFPKLTEMRCNVHPRASIVSCGICVETFFVNFSRDQSTMLGACPCCPSGPWR